MVIYITLSHKRGETHVLQRNQATPLLLKGTSNIKYIEPRRWYTTQQEIAYKIENAIDKIESYSPDMKPAVVIFHSLTNDIKSQLDAEGCVKMMSTLIEKTLVEFPDTKIVLFLAKPLGSFLTPRLFSP